MRRVVLLFNPAAGRNREKRKTVMDSVASALRNSGCEVESLATQAAGSAGEQAADACRRGADLVFACGGDGTVHDVLQGMAFQQNAAMGIVPLGSANALARHLRLPLQPVRAALLQTGWKSRVIPAGQVSYTTDNGVQSRYFAVMAGAGADGALVYDMLSSAKERFSRMSYYVRAARLLLTRHFASFACQMATPDRECERMRAVSIVAVRVGDLGGAFSPLLRGGSLIKDGCRVAVASAPARLSLSMWFALSWLGLNSLNGHVRLLDTRFFQANEGENGKVVQVQADGEWLGRTPMTVSIVPDALRLLVPDGPVY